MSRDKETNLFALRLPRSMRLELDRLAHLEGISINQFICIAIAEKIIRTGDIPGESNAEETPASTDVKVRPI